MSWIVSKSGAEDIHEKENNNGASLIIQRFWVHKMIPAVAYKLQ